MPVDPDGPHIVYPSTKYFLNIEMPIEIPAIASSRRISYFGWMANCRQSFTEHDLTLHVVSGELTTAEVMQVFQSLDSSCATRWLSYFDPSVGMSNIDIASVPQLKRVIAERRRELFGDHPKPYAIVCGSEDSEQYFIRFWWKYFAGPNAQAENLRCFRSLDEAYDWLELPDSARAAVARAIDDWEKPEATRGDLGRSRSAGAELKPPHS